MPQTLLHARACFPNVSQFPIPETLLPVSVFCFQDANYADATQQGILTKIRASEHLEKFCEHEQASTHLIFASSSSKGQILRALSNWMGPIDTPTSASSQANSFQILLGTTSSPGDLFNFTWLRAPKALANKFTLLRTHCCRHKCFPVCPRAQHLFWTQILCPGHKKCF